MKDLSDLSGGLAGVGGEGEKVTQSTIEGEDTVDSEAEQVSDVGSQSLDSTTFTEELR